MGRSRRGLPTGPQLAATRRGTGPPQVLTKKIGAQGAVGCSRRVGSVRQAYQRPVWTARRMVQGAQVDFDAGVWSRGGPRVASMAQHYACGAFAATDRFRPMASDVNGSCP